MVWAQRSEGEEWTRDVILHVDAPRPVGGSIHGNESVKLCCFFCVDASLLVSPLAFCWFVLLVFIVLYIFKSSDEANQYSFEFSKLRFAAAMQSVNPPHNSHMFSQFRMHLNMKNYLNIINGRTVGIVSDKSARRGFFFLGMKAAS